MDTKIWGDPKMFRPERFLDDKMKIINSEKLYAFGAGDIYFVLYTVLSLNYK